MEQTDNDGRGGGKKIMVERRGRSWTKNMYEGPTDVGQSVGTDCESRGWAGRKRTKGGKIGTTVI